MVVELCDLKATFAFGGLAVDAFEGVGGSLASISGCLAVGLCLVARVVCLAAGVDAFVTTAGLVEFATVVFTSSPLVTFGLPKSVVGRNTIISFFLLQYNISHTI